LPIARDGSGITHSGYAAPGVRSRNPGRRSRSVRLGRPAELLRAQEWLGAHGEVLTDLILIFIGVVVLGAGIGWL
jgi:hypothetical protein